MKKIISVFLAIILAAALFGCAKKPETPSTTVPTTQTTTKKVWPSYNPLTGEGDFSKKAVGRRPVAIVVENLTPARPQWAIGTSDIIVEGEVEGGISRMLWLYADYTKVPEKVGPIRSARPSYVKFSEYFDAIYIHWGGSHNNQNYVGGYTVIKNDKVNDFDGMKGGILFGRDNTRRVSSEHRGILHGDKIEEAIKEKGYRTNLKENKFSELRFNKKITDPGTDGAKKVNCLFSSRTDTRRFTYDEKDKQYHTNDWKTDVKFQNVIILMDETKYITVPYKGATTTYLNYQYKGGKGYYISNGKRCEITWKIKKNRLYLKDKTDEHHLKINKGKSYIGLASSNNGGSVTFE